MHWEFMIDLKEDVLDSECTWSDVLVVMNVR